MKLISQFGAIIFTAVFAATAACQERPACHPAELARIDGAFVAETVETCAGYTIDECPQYPAIKAKYAGLRDAWVACR